MSIRAVSSPMHVRAASRHSHAMPPVDQRGLSRRDFPNKSAGIAAIGAGAGAGLFRPVLTSAATPGIGDVLPIAGGSAGIAGLLGKTVHVYGPPTFDSPDSDPSTVGNFRGHVGLAYINGTVTETNRKTGAVRELPFIDADMRFMQGQYRGRDGHVRDGTFAFI